MGVAQIGPTVDVGGPEVVVVHQGIQDRDVTLPTDVTHVFGVTRVGLSTRIGQAGIVGAVTKSVVEVPQHIAPTAAVSIGVSSPPPCRVPVQPIRAHHIAVEDEVVDQ